MEADENDGLQELLNPSSNTAAATESASNIDHEKPKIPANSDGLRQRGAQKNTTDSEEKENKKPNGNLLKLLLDCVSDEKDDGDGEMMKLENSIQISTGKQEMAQGEKILGKDGNKIDSDEEEEDEEDEEGNDNSGDYVYDEWSREYIPRIREPPSDEDSEDGLLISSKEREASLTGLWGKFYKI